MTETTRALAKTKFIKALGSRKRMGSISYACKAIGYSRQSVATWRRTDKNFDEAVGEAIVLKREYLADIAEHALLKRLHEGNVTAIMFILKRLRPERWNDKYQASNRFPGRTIEDRYTISPEFAEALSKFASK